MAIDRNQIRQQALAQQSAARANPQGGGLQQMAQAAPSYVAYNPALGPAQRAWQDYGKKEKDIIDTYGLGAYEKFMGKITSGDSAWGGLPKGFLESARDLSPAAINTQAQQAYLQELNDPTKVDSIGSKMVAPKGITRPQILNEQGYWVNDPGPTFDNSPGNEGAYFQQQYENQQANQEQEILSRKQKALPYVEQYAQAFDKWKADRTSPILDQQLRQMGIDKWGQVPSVRSGEKAVNLLNSTLKSYGVEDWNDLGVAPDGNVYNKRTGQALPKAIHNFRGGSGDGSLQVYFEPTAQGIGLRTDYNKPKMKGLDWMHVVMPAVLGGVVTGGLGAGLGAIGGGLAGSTGAVAGQALGGALGGAATAGVQGQNIGQGALGGAIQGGLGAGIGAKAGQWNPGSYISSSPYGQGIVNQAVRGGVGGGLGAAIKGGDIQSAALQGLVSGASSGAISPVLAQQLESTLGKDWANKVGGLGGSLVGKGLAGFVPTPQQFGKIQRPQGALQQAAQQQPGWTGHNMAELGKLPEHAQRRIKERLGIA